MTQELECKCSDESLGIFEGWDISVCEKVSELLDGSDFSFFEIENFEDFISGDTMIVVECILDIGDIFPECVAENFNGILGLIGVDFFGFSSFGEDNLW